MGCRSAETLSSPPGLLQASGVWWRWRHWEKKGQCLTLGAAPSLPCLPSVDFPPPPWLSSPLFAALPGPLSFCPVTMWRAPPAHHPAWEAPATSLQSGVEVHGLAAHGASFPPWQPGARTHSARMGAVWLQHPTSCCGGRTPTSPLGGQETKLGVRLEP